MPPRRNRFLWRGVAASRPRRFTTSAVFRRESSVSPSYPTYEAELQTAIRAARAAGALIQQHAGRLAREDIWSKGRHDLVTGIDLAAQEVIVETILAAFPGHHILAEEGDASEARLDAGADGYRWIIDPIDGTTNFTHGAGPYGVSIGLQAGTELVLGVVLDVSRDELFTAVRGHGLLLNGEPAHVGQAERLEEALVTTGFPYRVVEHLDAYLEVLAAFMRRAQGVRRPGSASVDLAWVACGRFDGFFESGLSAWDVAAGTVLVREGGGQVTDFRGDPEPLFARQIVASNGRLHEEMLALCGGMRDVTA